MSKNHPVGVRCNAAVELLKDAAYYIVGAILYAIAIDTFISPNNVVPGGITGISTVLHIFYDLPIGTTMFVLNVPIFIAALIFIGWKYVIRSGICLGIVSLAIDILEPVLPKYTDNEIMGPIFGGALMGIALAVIFMRGGSTGGTDIVARIFAKFWPALTQGKLILMIDMVVIASAAVAFGVQAGSVDAGLSAVLLAIINLIVSTTALDKVLYGMNTGRQLFIITKHPDEVNRGIIEQVDRGTTIISGRGGYSGTERDIIMCAVRNNEVYDIRAIVRSIDQEAFIIVGTANEILGKGFRSIEKNEFGEIEEPSSRDGKKRKTSAGE